MDSDVMKAARDLREALDAMRVCADGTDCVSYDDVPGGPARAFRAALNLLAGIEAASEKPKPPLWSDTRKTHALIYMTGFINDLLAQRASGAGQMTISGVRGAELIRHLQELCRRDIEAASAEPQPSAAIATEADVPDEIQWAIDALCEAAYAWADSDSEPDSPEAQAERDAEKALKLAIMKPMRRLAAERDAALVSLGQLQAERDADEKAYLEDIENLKIQTRCPDCGCATPEDAEASECGCDSPVCRITAPGTLATEFAGLHAERDAMRKQVADLIDGQHAMLVAAGGSTDIDELERQLNSAGTKPSHFILKLKAERDALRAAKEVLS